MLDVNVREIVKAEYPLLEDFLYHAIFLAPWTDPPSKDIILDPEVFIYIKNFGEKDDCGVVAEKDSEIIGAAWTRIIPAYGHYDNDTPELAISVLPEYRRHSVGTMLMMELFELLCKKGYKQTSLAVQQKNPAVRFYKGLGYEVIRENDEEFIMMKKLGVKLRSWKLKDTADLAVAINNKKVLDNLRDGIPFPYTEKDAEEFITETIAAEQDTQYSFAITYHGKVIGSIGVFRKDDVHRLSGEMGYYIAEPYWNKGITTTAVQQMCDYVFKNTDIVRIFAEPYAHNDASCRVLEKAGFQFEGVLRQNAIKNGQLMDMKMYAIIKPKEI